jgi:type VI secretion system ImpM family protein
MDKQTTASADRRSTLFGKLPGALDFVRIHHETQEAIALDQWVQAAMQQLAQHGAPWPKQTFRFAFRPKGCASSIVGVIGPSRDRANRRFPVAAFAPLPAENAQRSFAAMVLGSDRFLDGAERLLDTLASSGRDHWTQHVESLSPPLEAELERAVQQLEIEVSRSSATKFFGGSVSPDQTVDNEQLAHTVSRAVLDMAAAASDRGPILDCSPRTTIAVATWLTVLQQSVPPLAGAPSTFWSTHESGPRMLLSLGAPPAMLPLWLADPRTRNPRLRSLGSAHISPPAAAAASTGRALEPLTIRQWLHTQCTTSQRG